MKRNRLSISRILNGFVHVLLSGLLLLSGFYSDTKAVGLEKSEKQRGSVARSQSPRSRIVLERLKAAREGDLAYEVSVGPCVSSKCPFQVSLVEGQRVLGSLNLDWSSGPGQPERSKPDESSGVGDPLGEAQELTSWNAGSADQPVSVVARTISLTPNLKGLLVHQSAGFEHVKRRHYLFAVLGKRLVRAWTGAEGAGPTWSRVDVKELNQDGSQGILFFNGFYYPSDQEPDWVEITIYRWTSTQNRLEELPASDPSAPVFAVIAGTYPTVVQAREAASNDQRCLAHFLVLQSEMFSQLQTGKFALVALTAREELARKALRTLESCGPAIQGSITKLQQRG